MFLKCVVQNSLIVCAVKHSSLLGCPVASFSLLYGTLFFCSCPPHPHPMSPPCHAQKCHQLSHFTLEVSPFHSFWKHRSHSRGPYNNYYFNILKPTKIFEIKKNNWPRDQAWFFSTFACFCGMLRSPVPPLQTHGGSIEAVIHYHPCKGDTFHEFHEPHWGVF